MRKVEVTVYSDQWPLLFEKEASILIEIFGEEIVKIHHIGSTSVKGLKAKPIIDIMPIVKDINGVDRYDNKMKAIGYECKGENGIYGRRYFQKGGDQRTHHVHVFQENNPQIDRHLAFRDFLRAFPDVAEKYGALKEELSKQFPYDIDSYIRGKNDLVQEIEKQALKWKSEQ